MDAEVKYDDYWALIDCNNFYVSCEQVWAPKFAGTPCVVLSNNDGCVISRSDEAKAMGIAMGEPYFLNKDKYDAAGVKVWSSNYELYGDMSSRVTKILMMECPEVQVYSIDESFAKFYGFSSHAGAFNFKEYLLQLRAKILKWTGIPVCIGVGPTKALAKVANRVAKKYKERTAGVHIIDCEMLREKALKWLPVEDIWGIGRQHSARLIGRDIKTAFEFTQLPDDDVRNTFSVVVLRLMHDLRGNITLDFEEEKPNKNIACTRSFKKGLTDYKEVAERMTAYACHAADKLRKQQDRCKTIVIFVTTGKHTEQHYTRHYKYKMEYPTNSSIELSRFALMGLRAVFQDGYVYKKCGVILADFVPEDGEQLALFGSRDLRHDAIMKAMDKVNKKYHRRVIQLAGEPKIKFDMRQDFLSPRYTTRFSDLLVIDLK